jgi:ATP-binding cassette subfamily F protein uup
MKMLSGGEQARVLIAGFMLKPADVLLLDEPTNDLDLQSLEVLEASIQEFAGALVLVTHDRYLLERVSQRLLALDGRGNARFFAELSQWESWMAEEARSAPPLSASGRSAGDSRSGLSARETRELKTTLRKLEAEIQTAEDRAERARTEIEDVSIATDAEELARRHEKLAAALRKVETLVARWSELQK